MRTFRNTEVSKRIERVNALIGGIRRNGPRTIADQACRINQERSDEPFLAEAATRMKLVTLHVFLFSIGVASAVPPGDSLHVEFRFSSPTARSVSVAGSFNGWSASATPMTSDGAVWRAVIALPAGYYYYKFVVDGDWIPDPKNSWRINDGGMSFNSIIKVGEPERPTRKKSATPFPKSLLPHPILENNPELVELYYRAWEMAWNKVSHGTRQNGFAGAYMDEGFNEYIYQWDTGFITSFGVYGRSVFPVMPSLDNFYKKQRSDGYIQRVYSEADGGPANEPTPEEPMVNPPLFAWVELRYFHITGDSSRLRRVLPVLVHYYRWLERHCRAPEGRGLFYITPLGSGMDNTPRPNVGKAGWVDFSAQQALAAKSISEIATLLKNPDIEAEFSAKHAELSDVINTLCWNPKTRFYHDMTAGGGLSPVKHIGAFWTLLADVCSPNRLEPLLAHLQNPKEFWQPHLVPTLSADDSSYDARGHYWLGSVWAPTDFMVMQGLTRHHRGDLADKIALNHLEHIDEVFRRGVSDDEKVPFEERYGDGYHTIWECYSPATAEPATRWDNTFYSRQDFVGWSGLGPIAMLIENVLGVGIEGDKNRITWRIHRKDKHGIERIQLGGQMVSLRCTPKENSVAIDVESEKPFDLQVTWQRTSYVFPVTTRRQHIVVNR